MIAAHSRGVDALAMPMPARPPAQLAAARSYLLVASATARHADASGGAVIQPILLATFLPPDSGSTSPKKRRLARRRYVAFVGSLTTVQP